MQCHLLFHPHEGAFDAAAAESRFCLTQLTEPSNFLRASESLRNKAEYVCIDYGFRVRACMFSYACAMSKSCAVLLRKRL